MFLASAYSVSTDHDFEDNNLQLWMTNNRGQKFDKIHDYVHLFEWANDAQEGHLSTIHPDRIFLI